MGQEDTVYTGTVIWFNKAFGFIAWDRDGTQQPDLFVHFSDIVMKDGGYKTLKKDSKVSFKLGLNVRQQPKAIDVQTLDT